MLILLRFPFFSSSIFSLGSGNDVHGLERERVMIGEEVCAYGLHSVIASSARIILYNTTCNLEIDMIVVVVLLEVYLGVISRVRVYVYVAPSNELLQVAYHASAGCNVGFV